MLMHRRARYRLGSVYEIINNRVSPDAIIFTSTLLRRYTFSPGYTFYVARFVIYVQYVTLTIVTEFYCRITRRNSQNSYYVKMLYEQMSMHRKKGLSRSYIYLIKYIYLFHILKDISFFSNILCYIYSLPRLDM